MMAKKKNHNSWKKSHYFLFLVLLSIIVVNCSDLVNQVDLSEKAKMSVKEVDQGPSLKTVSSSDQPTTPQRLLLENIYREIRYPAEARNEGIGGTFEATFIIDELGKMTALTAQATSPEKVDDLLRIVVVGYGNREMENTSTQRPSSELISLLEKEIERTLSTLPDWNPAQHEGEAVPVRMKLFFEYILE